MDAGLATAEAHGPIGHLAGAANQQGEATKQQHHQQDVADQTGGGLIAAVIANCQWHTGLLGCTQQLLVIAENRHLELGTGRIGDGDFPAQQGQLQVLDLARANLLQQLAIAGRRRFGQTQIAQQGGALRRSLPWR